jgi:tRNA dimethylallyltransferase
MADRSSLGLDTMSSSDASAADRVIDWHRCHPDDLLAIVGPTASGKTDLAIAVGRQIGAEIVSADSVQIYKAFDIGSGKPTLQQLEAAPHHLVSHAAPLDSVDAAYWVAHAARAIDDVRQRGRVPIVCGGTFLWVKALLYGLAHVPGADPSLRLQHLALAEREGRPVLHARLREVDPQTAERLHPNDLTRVSRALEVYELTGRPISVWHREHGFAVPRCPFRLFAIRTDTATLTARIQLRVRAWLDGGWVDEVDALVAQGYGNARAMGSVGYAQVRAMLAGTLPRPELEETIVRATRVFARRQRTWLRDLDVAWLS